jgi:hypothetical protein
LAQCSHHWCCARAQAVAGPAAAHRVYIRLRRREAAVDGGADVARVIARRRRRRWRRLEQHLERVVPAQARRSAVLHSLARSISTRGSCSRKHAGARRVRCERRAARTVYNTGRTPPPAPPLGGARTSWLPRCGRVCAAQPQRAKKRHNWCAPEEFSQARFSRTTSASGCAHARVSCAMRVAARGVRARVVLCAKPRPQFGSPKSVCAADLGFRTAPGSAPPRKLIWRVTSSVTRTARPRTQRTAMQLHATAHHRVTCCRLPKPVRASALRPSCAPLCAAQSTSRAASASSARMEPQGRSSAPSEWLGLRGKAAVITGGASGLGSACARELATHGVKCARAPLGCRVCARAFSCTDGAAARRPTSSLALRR